MVAVWVKLRDLPLQYYNTSSLYHIGSVLGTVLSICSSTLNLTHQMYARICVELDVSKPMLDTVFLGTSKENGWFQSLEYEGNNTFCTYCGLLGHVVGLCRKKAHVKGKAKVDEDKGPKATVTILKRGDDTRNKEKRVLRKVGLISKNTTTDRTNGPQVEDKQLAHVVTPGETPVEKGENSSSKDQTKDPNQKNVDGATHTVEPAPVEPEW